jgi:diadenylate cyclase
MDQLLDLLRSLRFEPIALLDIAITALLIYGLFAIIRGTRAVRLVIGVMTLYGVYVLAQILGLTLLSQILQTGAVVGLLALVVVFQPELRRALERIGRVGSFGWLLAPSEQRAVEHVAHEIAHAAALLAERRHGALIVIERETGLQDAAEQGVMLHADLSAELLRTIFMRGSALHDGAVIVSNESIVAAGVVLPLSETSVHRERYGTRHRAALGISEQTDAVAVVVSEETGTISIVEHAHLLRDLDEERLRASLVDLLTPGSARARSVRSALARPTVRTAARARRAGLPRRRHERLPESPAAAAASAGTGVPPGRHGDTP